jgi:hypothetical protein
VAGKAGFKIAYSNQKQKAINSISWGSEKWASEFQKHLKTVFFQIRFSKGPTIKNLDPF